MSDLLIVVIVTAATLIAVAVSALIVQRAPARLRHTGQMNFDLGKLLDRSGQVGVVVIAAGILDGVLGRGSVGEVVTVTVFGAWLIFLSSIEVESKT